jgi:hypothetical protein
MNVQFLPEWFSCESSAASFTATGHREVIDEMRLCLTATRSGARQPKWPATFVCQSAGLCQSHQLSAVSYQPED